MTKVMPLGVQGKFQSEWKNDLHAAGGLLPVSIYFAWSDTKARYKRSTLGPFWLVVGTAVGVAGLGLLWSEIFQLNKSQFIPSLTVGLVIWQFVSSSITESTSIFVRNASLIRNLPLPTFYFIAQNLFRHLINLGHNALVIFVVLLLYPSNLSIVSLLALPGLIILAVNLVCISVVFGFAGARYRDLEHLVSAFMPIFFFMTPVIFDPAQVGQRASLFIWNPMTHLIAIVRDPLLGRPPETVSYLVGMAGITLLLPLVMFLFSKCKQRLPFWV